MSSAACLRERYDTDVAAAALAAEEALEEVTAAADSESDVADRLDKFGRAK
jgi:hypothetical protein